MIAYHRSMRILRIGWLPLLAVLTAAAMIRSWIGDPYRPEVELRDQYGHNGEGALVRGLVLVAIELVVLLAILRPWSYHRSWGRALAAAIALAPWTLLSTVLTMHAGGVISLHALWLWIAGFVLWPMFLVSAIGSARSGSANKR